MVPYASLPCVSIYLAIAAGLTVLAENRFGYAAATTAGLLAIVLIVRYAAHQISEAVAKK